MLPQTVFNVEFKYGNYTNKNLLFLAHIALCYLYYLKRLYHS